MKPVSLEKPLLLECPKCKWIHFKVDNPKDGVSKCSKCGNPKVKEFTKPTKEVPTGSTIQGIYIKEEIR